MKQTAADKFSACDFKYSEGKDRVYQGVTGAVEVDQLNTPDGKANTITNAGSFDLLFTRAPTATKVQSVYLGTDAPSTLTVAGVPLTGAYFIDNLTEAASQ